MPDVASLLGPARLQEMASALRREASGLDPSAGGPLTPAQQVVPRAFEGPLGDGTTFLLASWQRELQRLADDVRHLSARLRAAADELLATGGLVPVAPASPIQDAAAAAITGWAQRAPGHQPFDPSGFGPRQATRGPRRIDPAEARHLTRRLEEAAGGLDGCRRNLGDALGSLRLEPPRELGWIAGDLRALSRELDRRVAIIEQADRNERSAAASSVAGVFAGLFAAARGRPAPVVAWPSPPGPTVLPGATARNVAPQARPAVTPRDQGHLGASDARRIRNKLKSGFFDMPDPAGAKRILAGAKRKAAADPAYAAGFLNELGPKGLRALLDRGVLDPCDLQAVVARASTQVDDKGQPRFGPDFLAKVLGKDRVRAPQRAALLGTCRCPDAAFDPAWTEQLVEVLYTSRDTSGRGDPRPWHREVAANLILQMAAFPPERAGAVQRLIEFAHDHPLEPAAKRAFATVLARPGTMEMLAPRLLGHRSDPSESEDFAPNPTHLRSVIADLAADPTARRMLLAAAGDYAHHQLGVAGPAFAATENPVAREDLDRIGALFGAIASKSYDLQAALDVGKVGEDMVKGLLETAGGLLLKKAEKAPVISLAVETGKTIVFAFASAELDRRERLDELRRAKTDQERREKFMRLLAGDLEHLAYVSLLADPAARARLGVNLDPGNFPADLPRDPVFRNRRIRNVTDWRDELFTNGVLKVPNPADGRKWDLFLAWARYSNPDLAGAAVQVRDEMQGSFRDQILPSL